MPTSLAQANSVGEEASIRRSFAPDDVNVIGAGGQPVLVKSGLNVSQTLATLPRTNLTALGLKNVWNADPGYNNVNVSTANTTAAGTSAAKTNAAAKPVLATTGVLAAAAGAAFALLL